MRFCAPVGPDHWAQATWKQNEQRRIAGMRCEIGEAMNMPLHEKIANRDRRLALILSCTCVQDTRKLTTWKCEMALNSLRLCLQQFRQSFIEESEGAVEGVNAARVDRTDLIEEFLRIGVVGELAGTE